MDKLRGRPRAAELISGGFRHDNTRVVHADDISVSYYCRIAMHAALHRIDDGTYGYCEETGDPIGIKRLEARPIATLSVEAQERHERRERIYRDD